MRKVLVELEPFRSQALRTLMGPGDAHNGLFILPSGLRIIVSNGSGWEHASASFPDRTPTWDEMAQVKQMVWTDEEPAFQIYPPKCDYVNCHPHTLHWWRPLNQTITLPPSILVGPKSVRSA